MCLFCSVIMASRIHSRRGVTPPPAQEEVLGVAEVVPQVAPAGQAQAGRLVQGTVAPDGSRQLEHFLKLHPPFFKGRPDPRVAEEWIA